MAAWQPCWRCPPLLVGLQFTGIDAAVATLAAAHVGCSGLPQLHRG